MALAPASPIVRSRRGQGASAAADRARDEQHRHEAARAAPSRPHLGLEGLERSARCRDGLELAAIVGVLGAHELVPPAEIEAVVVAAGLVMQVVMGRVLFQPSQRPGPKAA